MMTILALDDRERLTIPDGWVRFVRHGITYTRELEGIIATDAAGLKWKIDPDGGLRSERLLELSLWLRYG